MKKLKKFFTLLFCFVLLFSTSKMSFAENTTKNDLYKEIISLSESLKKDNFTDVKEESDNTKQQNIMDNYSTNYKLMNDTTQNEYNQFQHRTEKPLDPFDELMIRIIKDNITESMFDYLFKKLNKQDQDFMLYHFTEEFKRINYLSSNSENIVQYYRSTPYPQMKIYVEYFAFIKFYDSRDQYFVTFNKNTKYYNSMMDALYIIENAIDPNFEDEDLIRYEKIFEEYQKYKNLLFKYNNIEDYNNMVFFYILLPENINENIPAVFPYLENINDPDSSVDYISGADYLPDQLIKDIEKATIIQPSSTREQPMKEWTIRFNKKVIHHPDNIVYIVNLSKNKLLKAHVAYTNDDKITVFPKDFYRKNDNYIFFISDIHAADGSVMCEDVKMPFMFRKAE